MELKKAYAEQMKGLLGEAGFFAYLSAMEKPYERAMRLNRDCPEEARRLAHIGERSEIELVTLTSNKSQIVPDISSKALLETLGDLSQVKFWAIDPSLFESSLLEPSLLGGGL